MSTTTPIASAVPDWLAALADPTRPDTPAGQPFGLTLAGAPWIVATDGHVLVALHGDGAAPLSPAMAARFLPYEARLTEPGGAIAGFYALAEWIGPVPATSPMVRCDVCGGSGRIIEHEICDDCAHWAQCDECEGRGRLDAVADCRPGRLGAAVINRALLAPLWGHLTPGPVRVMVTSAEAPVGFHGDGWVVLVMPLRWDRDREVEAFAGMPTP